MSKNDISKEELSFYNIAARYCGLETSNKALERLILAFQGVRKHKGAFSVKHFVKIDAYIEAKYKQEAVSLSESEEVNDEDTVREDVPDSTDKVEPWDMRKGE